MPIWKKILIALVAVLAILAIGLYILFGKEVKTLGTLEKISEYPLYTMTYENEYYFDDYLEVGASTDGEVVEFIVNKLLKGLPLSIDLPDLGCSTFFAQTPEGDYQFGRNFDLYHSPPAIIHTNPKNGYASVSTVNLSFMGYTNGRVPEGGIMDKVEMLAAPYVPIDGMNEKGLAVGVLLIRDLEPTAQDTGKINLQTTTAIRMILDKCATVEEAVEMLKEYDMHSSAGSVYHFQITDVLGNSVVVEYLNNEMFEIYPTEDFYQACTNFVVTPGELYGHGRGHDRYEILMSKLEETGGIISEEEAMELLSAVKAEVKEDGDGNDSTTQWSVVFNQNDLTGTFSVGMDYDNLIKFNLEETFVD